MTEDKYTVRLKRDLYPDEYYQYKYRNFIIASGSIFEVLKDMWNTAILNNELRCEAKNVEMFKPGEKKFKNVSDNTDFFIIKSDLEIIS